LRRGRWSLCARKLVKTIATTRSFAALTIAGATSGFELQRGVVVHIFRENNICNMTALGRFAR
jgi:hypothetical protein